MKRGIVRVLLIVTVSAIVLLMAHSLLYGESNDSKHFSRPITPDPPARESGNKNPFIAGIRPFSGQFLPSPKKNFPINPRSIFNHRIAELPILNWSPDTRTHYHILEMKIRQDIDFKIRRVGK